ncbi:MCL1 (predicted) [Pycnogonum litorale]
MPNNAYHRNFDDPVVIKACKLVETVVNHLLGTTSLWSYCKFDGSDKAMCKLVDQLLYRCKIPIHNMVKSLNINRNDGYSAFSSVADEVLCDGPTWWRIVALYAFGGCLVVDCRKQGLNEFANKMTNYIGLYVGDKAGHWIKKQGGWESLVDWQRQSQSFSSKFFIDLVVIGLTFALLATFVCRK